MTEQIRSPYITEDTQGVVGRVYASIRLLISSKKRKEALVILGSMIEQIRLEPGCIHCRLYSDVLEERALMLEEIWSSEKDLERHLRSNRFHTVLLVIEMATESPEIRFDVVSRSTGIDAVERVRTRPVRPKGVST